MTPLPPGPKLPAILQLLTWIYRPTPFMEECTRRYGDCFTICFPGNPPIVLFSNPEAIKEIFTGNPDQFPAGEARQILRPLVGQHSVLVLDGARHRQQRRLMMPPFHGERMQAYGEVMREITNRVIENWSVGRSFPLQPQMQGITLDIILRTVFGIDEGTELVRLHDRLTKLLTLGANPLTLIPWFQSILAPFTGRQRMIQLIREVDDLLYAQITQRRAAGADGREDILTMLIQARDETGQPMTDVELRDELITLLVAGHETTATSLSWTFYHILQRPDVLEKLRAELRQVVGPGSIAPQHVAKLEYLDAVIKEVQRLIPILPLVPRRLHEALRIGGRDLPAGTVVAPCVYLTHHRPDLWPSPEQFDPDRFLHKRPTPYEFFPFGGGIRHCLGAAFAIYEMKIVVAEVLSRAALHIAPGQTIRVVRRGITFAPSAGMPVLLDAPVA